MQRVCIINVVGMTPALLRHAPRIAAVGAARGWRSPLPAVTSTCQATMLTGRAPADHGIVANGWYYRETQEIRFWQQANTLIEGEPFYHGFETAKMFWWFNQNADVSYSATPKPYYGCDGSKVFDILDHTGCDLQKQLGPFPFFSFWGPAAGLASSEWIARATALVMRQRRPQLTLAYLPHLDYDFQRYPVQDPARVGEVDQCAGEIIEAAEAIGARVVVVSEYGLAAVDQPVHLNRVLRERNWLAVRDGPFGELLMPGESDAFAVADHQLAHVYVRRAERVPEVREALAKLPGVEEVRLAAELELDHPRSGELVVVAEPNAWFTYYYWLDDARAPDFARTVDIHRKPGYDPCELFMTSRTRAALRLLQKKVGLRYKMDVVPLQPSLVRGSHGRRVFGDDGPLIVGPGELPADMRGFKSYVRQLLAGC